MSYRILHRPAGKAGRGKAVTKPAAEAASTCPQASPPPSAEGTTEAAAQHAPTADPTDLGAAAELAFEQTLDTLEGVLTHTRRRLRAADWLARTLLPLVLRAQGLPREASQVQALPRLRHVAAVHIVAQHLQRLSQALWQRHHGQDTPAAAVADAALDAVRCLEEEPLPLPLGLGVMPLPPAASGSAYKATTPAPEAALLPGEHAASEVGVYVALAFGVATEAAASADDRAYLELMRQALLHELAALPAQDDAVLPPHAALKGGTP